jgi:hypothetical protein
MRGYEDFKIKQIIPAEDLVAYLGEEDDANKIYHQPIRCFALVEFGDGATAVTAMAEQVKAIVSIERNRWFYAIGKASSPTPDWVKKNHAERVLEMKQAEKVADERKQQARRKRAEKHLTTASTVTAAPVDLAANNVDLAQPQVNPER